MKKRVTAALIAATLTIGLTVPAMAMEVPPIRVSSYKGSTLEVGERGGLIIGPGNASYTVTSGYPIASTSIHKQIVLKEGRSGSWMALPHGGRKQNSTQNS